LGSQQFRAELLERMEAHLGDHHSGRLRLETATAKAERVIVEELKRLGWKEGDLAARLKGDPDKLALAARLRRETTLTVAQIARRLHCGSWKSFRNKLYLRRNAKMKGTSDTVTV
jgi:hypothetical protein